MNALRYGLMLAGFIAIGRMVVAALEHDRDWRYPFAVASVATLQAFTDTSATSAFIACAAAGVFAYRAYEWGSL